MIRNLEDFFTQIKQEVYTLGFGFSSTALPWFRGQSDETWPLMPGIYRQNGDSEYEREMVRDFKLNANLKIHRLTESNLEILFLMQHYGMPTRLLDWTENYLTALYFAVQNFKNKSNSAVWVLMPRHLNAVFFPKTLSKSLDKTIPVSSDKRLDGYAINIEDLQRNVNEVWPLAIRPIRTSDRIVAQKGMFTIHGSLQKSLDSIIEDSNKNSSSQIPLKKIIIEGNSKLNILKELYAAGISHSVLFPELEGISQEIAFRYSTEFMSGSKGHKFNGFK